MSSRATAQPRAGRPHSRPRRKGRGTLHRALGSTGAEASGAAFVAGRRVNFGEGGEGGGATADASGDGLGETGSGEVRWRMLYLTAWTSPRVRFCVRGSKGEGRWKELGMRMSDETFAGGGSSGGLSGSGSFKRDGVASNIVSNRGANVCWHETEIVTAAPSVRGCGGAEAPSMEFVFTDGEDTWDNAPGGGNYSASVRVNRRPDAAGAQRVVIRVADGSVDLQHVFPRVLLVSDLDGTMVGDDAKTKRFREFWDGTGARGNGSRLIYSTGRSLPSFQSLQNQKRTVLAEPDVLIGAVGTKIYLRRGDDFVEDDRWSAILSRGSGWSLDAAREIGYRLLRKYGDEKVHFRPPDEQNEYKVTLGVLAEVADSIEHGDDAGAIFGPPLDVDPDISNDGAPAPELLVREVLESFGGKFIFSGSGAWRFVDIVPKLAGKYESMVYARDLLGFLPNEVVCCGDSGNDRAMVCTRQTSAGAAEQRAHVGVVVANAEPDLMEWAKREVAGSASRLYISSGTHADGILEALERFGYR